MPRGDILNRVGSDIDTVNTVDEWAQLAADITLVAAAGFTTLASVTFTLTAVKTILIIGGASGQFGNGATLNLVIRIDGVDVRGSSESNIAGGTTRQNCSVMHKAISLAVGSHTIDLRGACTGALVVALDAFTAPTSAYAAISAREQL